MYCIVMIKVYICLNIRYNLLYKLLMNIVNVNLYNIY